MTKKSFINQIYYIAALLVLIGFFGFRGYQENIKIELTQDEFNVLNKKMSRLDSAITDSKMPPKERIFARSLLSQSYNLLASKAKIDTVKSIKKKD